MFCQPYVKNSYSITICRDFNVSKKKCDMNQFFYVGAVIADLYYLLELAWVILFPTTFMTL